MKVLIIGDSGSGKSTIIRDLRQRGLTAYDTDDEPGATRLELRATGEPIDWPKGYVDWAIYSWRWQTAKIHELLNSADTVYIGGLAGNWQDFRDDFDLIIALCVDSDTHLHRLRTRTVHAFGHDERNIQHTVDTQAAKLAEFVRGGAVTIHNDRSVEQVVDDIIALTRQSARTDKP